MTALGGWGLPPEEDLKVWIEGIGDEDEEIARGAFEGLFRGCWRPLRQIGSTVARCSATGEDAVADVFMALWSNRRSVRVRTNVSTYLRTAVKNRSLTRMKRRGRLETLDGTVQRLGSDGAGPEETLYGGELDGVVEQAVAELTEERRAAIRMLLDGHPPREIAAALGISMNAVAIRIHRARVDLESLHQRLLKGASPHTPGAPPVQSHRGA